MDISVADSRDNVGNDGAVAWEQRRAHGLPPVSSSLSSVFSPITSQSDALIIGNKVMELWLLLYLVLSLITKLVR